ncbi:MAG TPA: TolC family protein [Candidatus Angelobacter sp.]|jgi:outer membrane protein TolC|nr:TolC family protein [Candidatus Angelobacter sp.]
MKSGLRVLILASTWVGLFFGAVGWAQTAASQAAPEPTAAKPVSFRTVIELAVRNSAATAISRADMQHARASVNQAKDAFLPQLMIGSGLGWSYGFPLSLEGAAPSIFNVTAQQFLFNLAQRDYIHAAKSEQEISAVQAGERRNDTIMEAALSYMQLDLLDSSITIQREQQAAAAKYQDVVNQRIQAGLDSQVELTRAKLAVARTRLDIAQTQSAADALRMRLSQLTGLPADSIRTVTESIPNLPDVSQQDDYAAQAEQKNGAVVIALRSAEAKDFKARGEHHQLYPAIDFAAQYAMLSRINNYDEFFLKFQRNNVTIGAAFRFSFLNVAQRAAAESARADANKAQAEVRNVKQQVSSDTLKLQRAVEQYAAAKDVAQLEHQLSLADIDSTHAKIESGQASMKDEQNARVAEHQRYTAYLSSEFDLDKAQVQLLRQIGNLESWALGPAR